MLVIDFFSPFFSDPCSPLHVKANICPRDEIPTRARQSANDVEKILKLQE